MFFAVMIRHVFSVTPSSFSEFQRLDPRDPGDTESLGPLRIVYLGPGCRVKIRRNVQSEFKNLHTEMVRLFWGKIECLFVNTYVNVCVNVLREYVCD